MKNWSFKAKLLGIVGGLSLVSIGLTGLMAFQGFEAVKRGKELAVKTAAEDILDKLDRNLFERYGDVQAFSVSEPARSGDPKRIVAFMADMMPTYAPVYQLMMVVNKKGKVIAVNEVDPNGKPLDTKVLTTKDFSNASWFQAAIKGEIKPGTAFVEDLHVDADVANIYGGSGRVMSFTAPIRHPETGAVLGVWTNRVNWGDVVEQIVKEQVAATKSDSIKVVLPYLMSSTGTFLLHPDGSDYVLAKSHEGFQEIKDRLANGSFVEGRTIATKEFSGDAYEATAKSKGYSIYPGIGWVASVQVPTADPFRSYVMKIVFVALLLQIVGMVASVLITGGIGKQFEHLIGSLTSEANELSTNSGQLNESSSSLATAATQQAASLQQTASSIEEISAMVNKSADSAGRSIKVAGVSHETATRGQKTVEDMISAIEKISSSNTSVMEQFEQSNQQLGNIIKVISEIGNKTKVINDIVFQTKLLSFNASVEAARAGEHGKGFAVVAEEVGNLAQMSGNSAKEIGDMLNESIATVQKIVDEAKGKVERLISDSKDSVTEGITIAKQCGEVLDEIVKNEGEINTMINEISTAAQEQATGVSEINKAMAQLDVVTHKNADVAQTTASQADQISSRAENLRGFLHGLELVVRGNKANQQSVQAKQASAPVAKPADSSSNAKVLNFRSPKATKSSHIQPAVSVKTAVGSHEVVPSENDSRFEEV